MGKPSQRKGRAAEHEVRDILKAAGWSACTKGIWDTFDVDWEGRDVEVKRHGRGMKPAYDAFDNGAFAYLFRADRKEWLITMPLDEYIRLHGPSISEEKEAA